MQMKMSWNRKTSRIFFHPARATALPHTLRRKLQGAGGFLAGLSYTGGMQHVTMGAPWRTRP